MVLALVAPAAGAAAYSASEWVDYGKPRPAPLSSYACAEATADCEAKGWDKLLQSRGEAALDAASGGQSYRVIVDDPKAGKGLFFARLEIAADGRATLTRSYAGEKPAGTSLRNDKLEAFLAALDASQFKTAAAKAGAAAACKDSFEIVFEALVEDRYRAVVECGDELGLLKAVDLLRAG